MWVLTNSKDFTINFWSDHPVNTNSLHMDNVMLVEFPDKRVMDFTLDGKGMSDYLYDPVTQALVPYKTSLTLLRACQIRYEEIKAQLKAHIEWGVERGRNGESARYPGGITDQINLQRKVSLQRPADLHYYVGPIVRIEPHTEAELLEVWSDLEDRIESLRSHYAALALKLKILSESGRELSEAYDELEAIQWDT